jgi:hypothetical protein
MPILGFEVLPEAKLHPRHENSAVHGVIKKSLPRHTGGGVFSKE